MLIQNGEVAGAVLAAHSVATLYEEAVMAAARDQAARVLRREPDTAERDDGWCCELWRAACRGWSRWSRHERPSSTGSHRRPRVRCHPVDDGPLSPAGGSTSTWLSLPSSPPALRAGVTPRTRPPSDTREDHCQPGHGYCPCCPIRAMTRSRPEVLGVPAATSANPPCLRYCAYFSTSDQMPFHSAGRAVARN